MVFFIIIFASLCEGILQYIHQSEPPFIQMPMKAVVREDDGLLVFWVLLWAGGIADSSLRCCTFGIQVRDKATFIFHRSRPCQQKCCHGNPWHLFNIWCLDRHESPEWAISSRVIHIILVYQGLEQLCQSFLCEVDGSEMVTFCG